MARRLTSGEPGAGRMESTAGYTGGVSVAGSTGEAESYWARSWSSAARRDSRARKAARRAGASRRRVVRASRRAERDGR
ncbi:MAG TPA: hypothetical protein VK284_13945 [Streptosporangiaceae bacterium]|nr:hypothetical protein [Streptosporangiaceae bacterium]HLN67262.1 hypothetical protein [Streptosporangiaceae bacterium]